jgi:hypothetical protein
MLSILPSPSSKPNQSTNSHSVCLLIHERNLLEFSTIYPLSMSIPALILNCVFMLSSHPYIEPVDLCCLCATSRDLYQVSVSEAVWQHSTQHSHTQRRTQGTRQLSPYSAITWMIIEDQVLRIALIGVALGALVSSVWYLSASAFLSHFDTQHVTFDDCDCDSDCDSDTGIVPPFTPHDRHMSIVLQMQLLAADTVLYASWRWMRFAFFICFSVAILYCSMSLLALLDVALPLPIPFSRREFVLHVPMRQFFLQSATTTAQCLGRWVNRIFELCDLWISSLYTRAPTMTDSNTPNANDQSVNDASTASTTLQPNRPSDFVSSKHNDISRQTTVSSAYSQSHHLQELASSQQEFLLHMRCLHRWRHAIFDEWTLHDIPGVLVTVNDKYLVSRYKLRVYIFDCATGKLVHAVQLEYQPSKVIATRNWLIVCYCDEIGPRYWPLFGSGSILYHRCTIPLDVIVANAFLMHDDNTIACAHIDGTLSVWELDPSRPESEYAVCLHQYQHDHIVTCVHRLPSSTSRLSSRSPFVDDTKVSLTQAPQLPEKSLLITGSRSADHGAGVLHVWDYHDEACISDLRDAHSGAPAFLVPVSVGGHELLLTASQHDRVINVWELGISQHLYSIHQLHDAQSGIKYLGNVGPFVLSADGHGEVFLFEIQAIPIKQRGQYQPANWSCWKPMCTTTTHEFKWIVRWQARLSNFCPSSSSVMDEFGFLSHWGTSLRYFDFRCGDTVSQSGHFQRRRMNSPSPPPPPPAAAAATAVSDGTTSPHRDLFATRIRWIRNTTRAARSAQSMHRLMLGKGDKKVTHSTSAVPVQPQQEDDIQTRPHRLERFVWHKFVESAFGVQQQWVRVRTKGPQHK